MQKSEFPKFVLEQKFAFLRKICEVCMLWWVSSVVFCGSVLGAALTKENFFPDPPLLYVLFGIILIFFASIVSFGIWSIISVRRIQKEVSTIHKKIFSETPLSLSEFTATWVGILIGSTSFFFVTIIWILIYIWHVQ